MNVHILIPCLFLTAITCSVFAELANGTIDYSRSPNSTDHYSYGTTATYQCNSGYNITSGDRVRTCNGNGSSPNGQWDGTAPQCPRMLFHCNWSCHMIIYTQLWTVALLRLLSMDLLGYQQPQHSQGQ